MPDSESTSKTSFPQRVYRIYIAGPIRLGDLCENINQATAAFVALANAGFAPHCPHWSVYCKPAFRFSGLWPEMQPPDYCGDVLCEATVDGTKGPPTIDWLTIDRQWLLMADALLRLPGESKGADQEVVWAKGAGIPVFESVEAVVAYFQ